MKNERLNKLRQEMIKESIDVYYFNTSDYHMSEYVPEYFKTIRYFSGFTGSLATLLVDKEKAYIFVDGRYHIQADKQCLENEVEVIKLGTNGTLNPIEFLKKNYDGKTIGLDGKRTSIAFGKELIENGLKLKSVDIYSKLIENRQALSTDELWKLDLSLTGKSTKDKINEVLEKLNGKCLIINNLEAIAYTLNLRSNDIINTPVFLSYLVFYKDKAHLFINTKRLNKEILADLEKDGIIIDEYDKYYEFLKEIKDATISIDENKVNYETFICLQDKNNSFINERSLIDYMKAIKNETEIKNSKLAHIYDGVAMVRFLKWIDEIDKTTINEYDAAEYLNNCRLSYKAFDLSFQPIVAYNANAAMMHYSPTKEDSATLDNKGSLLIDSGGHYLQGTTDITRTIALGEVSDKFKKHFTLVLKSMFNLSSVKFLKGMAGCQLDILARKDLWELGIDYRCGTGHGVGHILSVHENPANIRYTIGNTSEVPLAPGHIFSDEPGVYLEGEYGIRCENMLLCKNDEFNEYGQFLSFETLTMCPFDLRLIDKKYLDDRTINLLNNYHKTVYDNLSPYLNDEEKDYLMNITRSI